MQDGCSTQNGSHKFGEDNKISVVEIREKLLRQQKLNVSVTVMQRNIFNFPHTSKCGLMNHSKAIRLLSVCKQFCIKIFLILSYRIYFIPMPL